MTFFVGSLPEATEKEPNNDQAHAQKVDFNSTINGVVNNEDIDCFSVEVKKGQRFSVEVEGMRLGRGPLDARLTILNPDGSILADEDDTWLAVQDPFISLLAPADAQYTIQLREVTYAGSDKCHYRLHIGSFPRPTSVFPPGGKAGDTVTFSFFSEATGEFSQKIKLPGNPGEKFGVFAELDGLTAPTPRTRNSQRSSASHCSQRHHRAKNSGKLVPLQCNQGRLAGSQCVCSASSLSNGSGHRRFRSERQ
jgi:hypothetical protein